MGNLNDLFTALQMLDQGVQKFAIGRAINSANEEVQALNTQMTDEAQRLAGTRGIAQRLTMQLTGIGANPAQIEQVAGAIAPKSPLIQSAEQGYLMGDETQRARSKELLDREANLKRSLIREQQTTKADEKMTSAYERAGKRLSSEAKKSIEAYNQALTLGDMIQNGQSLSDEALKSFAARASGEVGNLTEQERQAYSGGRSLMERIIRSTTKNIWGTLPQSDRAQLTDLADVFKKGAARGVQRQARLIASQFAKTRGVSVDEAMERILPTEFGGFGDSSKKQAAPRSNLNLKDPRVKKALEEGWSPEEIEAYLRGK